MDLWKWFERFVLTATMVGIIIGVVAYIEEREARMEAREINKQTLESLREQKQINAATFAEYSAAAKERELDSILRAWEVLTRPSFAKAGKEWALNFLNSKNEDLSCEKMGGYMLEGGYCSGLLSLNELDLRNVELSNSKFRGVSLHQGIFDGADLSYSDLSYTNVADSVFHKSNLWHTNFRGAFVAQTDFSESNISNTDFTSITYEEGYGPIFTGAWAWEDMLPIGLKGVEILACKPVFLNGLRHVGIDVKERTQCTKLVLD